MTPAQIRDDDQAFQAALTRAEQRLIALKEEADRVVGLLERLAAVMKGAR